MDERLLSFRWPAKSIVTGWIICTVVAFYFCFSAKFDSDFKKFDGSEPAIVKAEKNFHDVWGGRESQAIFVIGGRTLDEAMENNDMLYRDATAVIPAADFSSLALFWPSAKLRRENSERWDRFWAEGRETRLKDMIRSASGSYGFSTEAFDPFFEGLHAVRIETATPSGAIEQLKERFIVEKGGMWKTLSFFPDRQEYLDRLQKFIGKYPDSFIVSGKAISAAIAEFTSRETKILAPLAVIVNIVLAWLFFRNIRETLISLVPILTGIVWFVGIMSMLGIPLNAVNIIAAIVSTGVIVDYGIGVTYEYRYNLRIGTIIAVTLSAATNIIGSGVLLFANYPALYSTGIALVICMVAGYFSAVVVVPALCSLMAPSLHELET
jgi:predicted exporter